jgi:hypothetical protein
VTSTVAYYSTEIITVVKCLMKPGHGVNVIILSLNDANYTRTNQMTKNISVAPITRW